MMLDKAALLRKHYGTDDMEELKVLMRPFRKFDKPERPRPTMSLPYYAPDPSLPPIPTPEEIEEVISTTPREYKACSQVYRMNSVYAVKEDKISGYIQDEAENLLFLQDHAINSVKVYALYQHKTKGGFNRYYIVTDWINGITLDEEGQWNLIEKKARMKILGKLGEQLKLLRSIPPPQPNYYGRVNNQPFNCQNMFIDTQQYKPHGPFYTYESFLQQVWEQWEVTFLERLCDYGYDGPVLEFNDIMHVIAANFPVVFDKNAKSGEPKLTHGDLHIGNFMLVPPASHVPDPSNPLKGIEDFDLIIIDWDRLAWLPAWCDCAILWHHLPGTVGENILGISDGVEPYYLAEAFLYTTFKSWANQYP
ncbi:kinase-like domain-containing protein [Phaeosphaeriaceae sp. PMI808]|nr:kinase-like domain-containing protein [Phaeosphaeriaceae sp. PMI808]